MSSRLRPLVSGTRRQANTWPAMATTPKSQNVAVEPSALMMLRKVG